MKTNYKRIVGNSNISEIEFSKGILGILLPVFIASIMIFSAGAASYANQTDSIEIENLYIIHFDAPVESEWGNTIETIGADVITYHQGQGYEVRMTQSQAEIINALPYVSGIDEYPNSYKISPDITEGELSISLLKSRTLDDTVSTLLEHMTVLSEGPNVNGHTIIGSLKSTIDIQTIASMPDVNYIAPYIEPYLEDELGAQIVGGFCFYDDPDSNPSTPYRDTGSSGTYVNHLGWTGNGVTIAISDTGLGDGTVGDAGHSDFTGRVVGGYDFGTGGWADEHSHGTHCGGLAAADCYNGNGVTYAGHGPYYVSAGLATGANLYAVQIFEGPTGSWVGPTVDYGEIVEQGYAGGARISSNSWGGAVNLYDTPDEQYDRAIRDADPGTPGNQQMITIKSAGNSGPGLNTITSPGNAKNILTVGGVENYMPDATSYGDGSNVDGADTMYTLSSRGWTADGRIKPDIVAPADGRLSTRSPSANPTSLYSEDGRYVWKSGTSMACPTVAGGAALIYEWFIANKGVAPTPAMVKAIMINTAIDFATPDIPNQNEGWGRMYMPTFFDPPAPFILHDAPTELTTGVTDTYSVSYSNPAEPLKITLAYTDRYALAGAPITLLNQVNLEVESPTGSIYSGNAFVNGWSQAGTNPIATFDTNGDGKDDRNNVECVYIPAGSLEPGQYTIRIIGFNVPADADNDGSNDQDYSLVIYNGEDVSSKGTISLDQELYAIEDTVTIEVGDTDLNTLPGSPQSVTVDIDSDSETGVETVLLTETGDDTSRFVGTKTISATNGGGILEVSDGDTITVTYDDADDGSGPATVTDTALVDGNVEPISGLTVDWWGVTNTKDVVSSVSFTRGAQTNDYSFTHDQDDSYHQIVETVSGGSGRMNIDFQYTINIDPFAIGPYSVNLDAYTTGETLTATYSTNGGLIWNALGTITSTSDTDTYSIWGITANAGDSVLVDIIGTSVQNEPVDTLYVDHLYIMGGSTSNPTDHNTLNWTLSGDDGAGANDVAQYNIYRADTPIVGAYIDSVPAGTDTYTDLDKGQIDGIQRYYVVRAEDIIGNEDTNTVAVPEPGGSPLLGYDIDTSGYAVGEWAFVSFAYVMNDDIETVLADSSGTGTEWDIAKWYNPLDTSNPWKTYSINSPSLSDMPQINQNMGVWLHLTANDGTLTTGTVGDYSGSAIGITLQPGWNLVGYPSATGENAFDSLLGLGVNWIGEYQAASPYINDESDLTQVDLSEGNAYWIHVDALTVWTVDP